MAKRSAAEVAFVFVDGYDLKGVETQFDHDIESPVEESHGLGPTPGETNVRWTERLATGVRQAAMSQQGFFDEAVGSQHEAFNEQQGVERIAAFGVEGNVAGRAFVGMQGAFGSKYSRLQTRGALHKANVTYTVSGRVDEGHMLLALDVVTADLNTEAASIDNGGASSGGGAGYVFAADAEESPFDLDGYDDVVVKILHSDDDAVFVELIEFDPITARDAQRVAVAGTVERYLAVDVAFTGTGTSPTVPLMVGFARG